MTTPLKAFGATFSEGRVSLGWNTSPSSFSMTLVEDLRAGDSFKAIVGEVSYLTLEGLTFGGVVQSFKKSRSVNGNPIYNVTVVSPTDILAGVQLILSDYSGPVNVPNLINVYGILEAVQYGNAQETGAGIEYVKILQGLQLAFSQGARIQFRGQSFWVSLAGIPLPPQGYRIPSSSMSLLDLISTVCGDIGHDFYLDMENVGGFDTIFVRTVSRIAIPNLNAINTFLDSVGEYSYAEEGRELRQEVTGTFIVGGQQINMFQQSNDGGNDATEGSIWPYWGTDAEDNIINSTGTGDSQKFTVDSRAVQVIGLGDEYEMTVAELRSAMAGADEWSTYVSYIKPNFAKGVGMFSKFDPDAVQKLISEPIDPKSLLVTSKDKAIYAKVGLNNAEENWLRLYEFVREYAGNYWGRQFLIRVPFVLAAIEQENGTLKVSQEPAEGGWVEDGEDLLGLSEVGQETFSLQDYRVGAFAKFSDWTQYDLKELNQDDYFIEDDNLFLRCSVSPDLQFMDRQTAFSPRGILQLAAPVYFKTDDTLQFSPLVQLLEKICVAGNGGNALNGDQKKQLQGNLNNPAVLSMFAGYQKKTAIPDAVAIPLKSNILTYGPWSAIGAVGGQIQVDFNQSLVPWEYGSIETMNLAGNALAAQAISFLTESEMGSITVPGLPTLSAGDILIEGGPTVTAIEVGYGVQGIETTYTMRTFSPAFGVLSKSFTDNVARLGKYQQKLQRGLKKAIQLPPPGAAIYQQRAAAGFMSGENRPTRMQNRTPHDMIMGKIINTNDGKKKIVTITETLEKTHAGLSAADSGDYANTAAVDLASIFVPFTVSPTANLNLPAYENPSSGSINLTSLNPYRTGMALDLITRGTEFPSDLSLAKASGFDSQGFRAMALRAPLILSGWGYSTSGTLVPSGDYLGDPTKWKTGPLDVRWDDDRKVWAAGGSTSNGSGIMVGYFQQTLSPLSGVGQFRVYQDLGDLGLFQTNQFIQVRNRFSSFIPSGAYGTVGQTNNVFGIINVDCA